MNKQVEKVNLVTILVLGVLIVQMVLSAGLLIRINQVYRLILQDRASVEINAIDYVDGVSPDDDPFIGPMTAPVTIVEFSDFACGHCREAQATLAMVKERYGDRVRIVYRDFSLGSEGSPSFTAALAAECADDQDAFWEMHDLLFKNQPTFDRSNLRSYAASLGLDMEQFHSCMESRKFQAEIAHDRQDGISYGVSGTPTFFINGHRLVGSAPLATFQRIIDQALQGR